jgi:excisionase family DNA binding protein
VATAKKDLATSRVQGQPHDQLLTVEQVAERLNVTVAYVRRRLIFEGRIAYVKVGRKLRVEPSVLEEFISQGRVVPGGYGSSSQKFVPKVGVTRRR